MCRINCDWILSKAYSCKNTLREFTHNSSENVRRGGFGKKCYTPLEIQSYNGPRRAKMCLLAYANSEGPDQGI